MHSNQSYVQVSVGDVPIPTSDLGHHARQIQIGQALLLADGYLQNSMYEPSYASLHRSSRSNIKLLHLKYLNLHKTWIWMWTGTN